MSNYETDQLADGVLKLAALRDELIEENDNLRAELEMFQKRAQAEELLLRARHTNAPDSIKARTIDDFFDKRAELETSELDKLDKIAGIVELYENSDSSGFDLSDLDDSDQRGDLTGWLKSLV